MAAETVRVRGLREFLRATSRAEKESRDEVRQALKEAAEPVRVEAVRLVSPVSAFSAAGYKVVVRQRGVAVESSRRKTTGLHPEWGSWQMRHGLVPALEHNEDEIEHRVEHALDLIAHHFERT